MKATSITPKGQIVIPAEIRKRYGLKPGTKVSVVERGGQIIIIPSTKDYIRSLAGIIPSSSTVLEILKEERKKDKARNK